MKHSLQAVILSVRVLPKIREQLEKLSLATGKTKSFLVAGAIQSYLETQVQVNTIQTAFKKADSQEAEFFDHHEVVDWIENLNDSHLEKMFK